MKIIKDGHAYQLRNFESDSTQEIKFIQKAPRNPATTELETLQEGTTNEEVLAMLINRMYFLQEKFPCRENALVITKLEESLMWLEKRTEDRKRRGVEGKFAN